MTNRIAPATLTDYAVIINDEHRAAFGCAQQAIEHARVAGEHLLKAKAALKHGEWLPWLEMSVEVGARQAQKYMKLAENWPAISAKYESNSYLSIDEALADLPKPEPVKSVTVTAPVKSAEPTDLPQAPQPAVETQVTELDALKSDYRELIQQAAETQADLDSLSVVVESDDKLKAALAEAKKYREMNRILEERIRGLQNEKNEAIRAAKSWQRKYEALAKK
jgi:hypothetical protein